MKDPSKGIFRQYVDIIEQKTSKPKRFPINDAAKAAIMLWWEKADKPLTEYMFPTRSNKEGHMTRKTAYRIIEGEARRVGVENIGTHSLRKTFGYWMNRKGVPISVIMKMFNHSSEVITLRYLGIDREQMDEAYNNLNLQEVWI